MAPHPGDGLLDLRSIPDGIHSENINLGAFDESRFHQPFGRFTGTLRLRGSEVRVTGTGVVEQRWATW